MEDAEELSQDIFMEIIGSIKRFRKTSSLSTWIYRMTVNKSLNHLKKNRRRKLFSSVEDFFHKRSTGAERIPDELSTTTTRLEDRERRELLNQSILSLPDNQRIAFTLSKYEGLSYQEIAEIMNLSISSIESLLHRAKLNLQKKLARDFSELLKR
jgi:RNA polymerase sigma-70 factor (ECF subfamily)